MNKIKLYLKSIISNKILCLDNKLKDVETSFNFKGNSEHVRLFDSIEAANEYIIEHDLTALRARPIEYKSKKLYFYSHRDHLNNICEVICFYDNEIIDYYEGKNKQLIARESNKLMLIEHNRDHEFYELIEHIEHLKK